MSETVSRSGDPEGVSRENTSERFLYMLRDVHRCMDSIAEVIGAERFVRFSRVLRALDVHADPQKIAFNRYVGDSQNKAFIWMQLASCGTELQTAWNTLRLANIAASRRCARVALEFLSTAIAEGMPIAFIRSRWAKLPKKNLPLWKMYFPRECDQPGEVGEPLIPCTDFPHLLIALLPDFPGWDDSRAADLKAYLNTHLHPYAHGTAQAGRYFLTMTSEANPVMGAVHDRDHPELYTSMADEIIGLGEWFDQVLTGACQYLQGGRGNCPG